MTVLYAYALAGMELKLFGHICRMKHDSQTSEDNDAVGVIEGDRPRGRQQDGCIHCHRLSNWH